MFKDAIEYVRNYQLNRAKALNNGKKPMRWFTSEVDDLNELIETFSTKDENKAWSKLYNGDEAVDVAEVQAQAIKIAYQAGLRRDLRILYVAGEKNRQRVPLDQDRFEFMRLPFHAAKLDNLRQIVESKEGGVA